MAKPPKRSTKKQHPITVEITFTPEQRAQITSWSGIPMDTKAHVQSFAKALIESMEAPPNRVAMALAVDITDQMR